MFRTTTEVMLRDGVLTREEKRLIIKLANSLGLSPEDLQRYIPLFAKIEILNQEEMFPQMNNA